MWEILTDCRPGGEEHQSWELHFSEGGLPIESLYNPKVIVLQGGSSSQHASVEIRDSAENITLNKVVQFHPNRGIMFSCTGGNGISYIVFARDVYAKQSDKAFKQSLEDHRYFVDTMAILLDSDKADNEFYGLLDSDEGAKKATNAVLRSLAEKHSGATSEAIQQRLKIVTACVSSSEEVTQFLEYIQQDPSSAFPISDCQHRTVYSYADNIEVEFDITLTGITDEPFKQGLRVYARVDKVSLQEIDRSFEEQQDDGGSDDDDDEEDLEEERGESDSSKKRKAKGGEDNSKKKKKKKKEISNPEIQKQLETKFLGKTIVIPLHDVIGSVYKTDGTSLVAINDYLQCWLPYAGLTNPNNPYLHRRLPKLF